MQWHLPNHEQATHMNCSPDPQSENKKFPCIHEYHIDIIIHFQSIQQITIPSYCKARM